MFSHRNNGNRKEAVLWGDCVNSAVLVDAPYLTAALKAVKVQVAHGQFAAQDARSETTSFTIFREHKTANSQIS
jgi:hypothetical protein